MPETALPPARLKISGTQDTFLAQINPAEFTHGVSISYGDESTTGAAAPTPLPRPRIGNETLSFSLILDDTGALVAVDGRPDLDLRAQLKQLSAIVGLNKLEGATDVGPAQVTWAGKTWPCRLNDMSVDYTLFAADGAPLRAKVQLSLSVCRTETAPAAGGNAGGAGRSV